MVARRAAGQAEERDHVHEALDAVRFAYCPSRQECNVPAGSAMHPPADFWSWSVAQVSIWPAPPRPPLSSVPVGRSSAGKQIGTCVGGQKTLILAAVKDDQWPRAVADLVADDGQALAVPADVTDRTSVDAAVAALHEAYGLADPIVNNTAAMLPTPVDNGRADEWTRMIGTNITGAPFIIRAFTADLAAAATDGRSADLVNLSSMAAHPMFLRGCLRSPFRGR